MADCQLGAYASFSGMTEQDIADFAERNMVVRMAPKAQGFAWDAAKLEKAIKRANIDKPSFVMIGGDMVDDLSDAGQLAAYHRIVAQLDDSIPLYVAPGNHDMAYDSEIPTEESVTAYRNHFGADHYSFSHHDTSFVVINTTLLGHPQEVPYEADRQMEAVERNFARAADMPGETLLVGHHPLFLQSADEPDTYWNMPRAIRMPLLELTQKYGVSTMLAGHLHRNNVALDAGIEVVASGAVGYSLGHDPSGVRKVSVTANGIDHYFVSAGDADDELGVEDVG